MADEILIDIKIPADDIEAAVKNISNLRGRVEELRKTNKGLDKSSEAYTKNAIEIKELNKEIRTNERVLIANNEAQKANSGSVTELRRQLSVVSQQWADLSQNERENTEAGKALGREKLSLTNRLKDLEKATGDNRRNVGNYTQSMRRALGGVKTFAGGLTGLNRVMNANPALMLANMFRTLLQQVGAAQPIMDAVNRVMVPLNMVFQRAIGILQDLATKAIDRVRESFDDLGQTARNFVSKVWDLLVMNRIRAAQRAFAALGKIMRGDIKEGFAELGKAAVDGMLGVENAIDKARSSLERTNVAFKEFNAELAKARRDGERLNEVNIKIAETKAEQVLVEGELNRELEKQLEISRNRNATEQERQAAADRAIEIIDQQKNMELDLLELQIEKAQIEADQNDTDREAQIELNRLISQRAQIEANSVKARRQVNSQLQQLERERRMDEKKQQDEADKQAIEDHKEYVKSIAENLDRSINQAKEANQDYIDTLKKQYLEGVINFEEYQDRIAEMEEDALVYRMELIDVERERIRENEELSEIEREELMMKLLDKRREAEHALTDIHFQARRTEVEQAEKAADEEIREIERVKSERQRAQMQAIQGATAMSRQIVSIYGKQLKQRQDQLAKEVEAGRITEQQKADILEREITKYKNAQKSQAMIDTYASAVSAYNALAGIPVVGPALAIAAAAAAIAAGLKNVSMIEGQSTMGFADGIIGLDGAGTSKSDSIPARLSKGESVLTAKATNAFAPQLAMMERAVGNNPNLGRIGRGKFAEGVINAGRQGAQSITRSNEPMVEALQNMKIYTSVTEFREVDDRLSRAERSATFIE